MKKATMILVMVSAFALCFALAGCSGGGEEAAAPAAEPAAEEAAEATTEAAPAAEPAAEPEAPATEEAAPAAAATAAAADSAFIGDWRMLDGVVDGTTYTASDLATANNMGMGVTLTMNADGTLLLDGGGGAVHVEGTWTEADGKAECDGGDFGTFTLAIDGTGIMTMTLNGEDSHFAKK